jgi:malonate-semialdehyde dehydrogenase (acetylating)/methylmalonate-semialdehyde dehydrogenase
MMVPCWMFPLAIACGNTFVFKPSERTPILATRLVELFHEAGLPVGVLNVVHGAHDVVNGFLEHPDIRAISFVGSQPVAEYVYKQAAAHGKRVQALAGAKNHSIVMPDADLDQAVQQIISAAFGSAGERCMACAVVVAVGDIADVLTNKLMEAADRLNIGNGMDKGVFLGPVIRESQKQRAIHYIETGEQEGALLVRDGRNDKETAGKGYFVGPTMFDKVSTDMKIWKEEIFAPVMSIVRVNTLQDAIDVANRSDFANGACLFTQSGKHVRDFRENIDAGMLGVNWAFRRLWPFFLSRDGKNPFTATSMPTDKTASNFTPAKK